MVQSLEGATDRESIELFKESEEVVWKLMERLNTEPWKGHEFKCYDCCKRMLQLYRYAYNDYFMENMTHPSIAKGWCFNNDELFDIGIKTMGIDACMMFEREREYEI